MPTKFIIATILIILILGLLIGLGFWQLDRAQEKRLINENIRKTQTINRILVKNANEILTKEHHKILLNGHYDNNKQFIYDNQTQKNNAGYYVLTPFLLNNDSAILINRGFVSWQGNRNKLIDTTINSNNTTIKVRLIKPVKRIELKKNTTTLKFPLLIQSLDINKLQKLTNYEIIPMIALLNENAENGFYRKWQTPLANIHKHLAYAMQWFLMALALLIIAIILIIKYKKY